MGYNGNFDVPRRGSGGGLMILWKNVSNVQSFSPGHSDILIQYHELGCFKATGFHGHSKTEEIFHSWDMIKRMVAHYHLDWLLFGDFNEIELDGSVR